MVARQFRVLEAASSSPATSTKQKGGVHPRPFVWSIWLATRNRFKPQAPFSFPLSSCGLMNSPQASSEFRVPPLRPNLTNSNVRNSKRIVNGLVRFFLYFWSALMGERGDASHKRISYLRSRWRLVAMARSAGLKSPPLRPSLIHPPPLHFFFRKIHVTSCNFASDMLYYGQCASQIFDKRIYPS